MRPEKEFSAVRFSSAVVNAPSKQIQWFSFLS